MAILQFFQVRDYYEGALSRPSDHAGISWRGARLEVYEGAPEVLHYWKSRGSPAGQDDRPRPQQVQGDVRQGGRGVGAYHGQTRLRPDVLMSV